MTKSWLGIEDTTIWEIPRPHSLSWFITYLLFCYDYIDVIVSRRKFYGQSADIHVKCKYGCVLSLNYFQITHRLLRKCAFLRSTARWRTPPDTNSPVESVDFIFKASWRIENSICSLVFLSSAGRFVILRTRNTIGGSRSHLTSWNDAIDAVGSVLIELNN